MNKLNLEGFDLKLDTYVQKYCEAVVASSANSKKYIGVLALITILSFLSTFNSQMNWSNFSMRYLNDKISKQQAVLKTQKLSSIDSLLLLDSIATERKTLYDKQRDFLSNYRNIHIPIIGNTIDINNLGVLSGLSFSILLALLLYSFKREHNNLISALRLISKRYSDKADENDFKNIINKYTSFSEIKTDEVLSEINKLRRMYHFNFLRIHDFFHTQNITPKKNKHFIFRFNILFRTFWIPFWIYSLIFFYDLMTIQIGLNLNFSFTFGLLFYSLIFFIVVFILTRKCSLEKKKIILLYKSFKGNNYLAS